MASENIVYLVTAGEYDDMRPEAIMATPELANALAEKLEYPNIIPMPVLDYLPEKVTVYQYLLRLDPREGWVMHGGPDAFIQDDLWDFEAPKSPAIAAELFRAPGSAVHQIRITHRERAVARREAEDMLTKLRSKGAGECPE